MQVEEIIRITDPCSSVVVVLNSIGYKIIRRTKANKYPAQYHYQKDGNIFEIIKLARTSTHLTITLKSIE